MLDEKGEVQILIKNHNRPMQKAARRFGFTPTPATEENGILEVASTNIDYRLEAGFRVRGLDEGFDIQQYNRVMWKGFDHEGEPEETPDELESRRRQLYSPNANHALKVAVVAPSGEYVSYCGAWFDPANSYVLIEPVATRPDYRRRGFGKAAVLEAVRRAAELGAEAAVVGSNQQFYYSIGFDPLPPASLWRYRQPGPAPT